MGSIADAIKKIQIITEKVGQLTKTDVVKDTLQDYGKFFKNNETKQNDNFAERFIAQRVVSPTSENTTEIENKDNNTLKKTNNKTTYNSQVNNNRIQNKSEEKKSIVNINHLVEKIEVTYNTKVDNGSIEQQVVKSLNKALAIADNQLNL